jgi:hypothetical protein
MRSASTPAPRTSSDGIETLFVCSNSRIVAFTTASPTERTLAAGVLRIYRVTASHVSFLNSGTLLHTIFPRSQCWRLDDRSVFVLRVRQDSYYRIELPSSTDEDKASIAHFASVLAQVLQYEKTPCPFSRGSEVETAPERPRTPPRKHLQRQPAPRAKKWTFDKTWVPHSTASGLEDNRSSVSTDSSDAVREAAPTNSNDATPKPARRLSIADRVNMFQGTRSATAPVVTNSIATAHSISRIPDAIPESPRADNETHKPVLERQVSEADSIASSADSFYSVETTQYRSPSPRFLDAEPDLSNPWGDMSLPKGDDTRGRSIHRRKISEITVRPPSTESDNSAPVTPTFTFHRYAAPKKDARPSSAPCTPPLVNDSSDDDSLEMPGLDVTTPPEAIRMTRLTGASQRRAFSPMPQPKNLFIPTKPNVGRQLTTALVRKTCELVLGPPAHLVSMMLRIAASISNFGFSTYRFRREEKIPCSWESDEEAEWPEEDDFGIPLGNMADSAQRRRAFLGEID